jgi:hypothetical protein
VTRPPMQSRCGPSHCAVEKREPDRQLAGGAGDAQGGSTAILCMGVRVSSRLRGCRQAWYCRQARRARVAGPGGVTRRLSLI